jgi:hypothetical protein
MFGFPGFHGGLLRQLQRFHRRGWPAVGALKVRGQDAPPSLNGGSTTRPPSSQIGVDADDFTYRPLPHIPVGTLGEPDAQTVTEMVL